VKGISLPTIERNWPVIMTDQIKDYDNTQIRELGKLLATNMVVVFSKPQNLTPEEQIDITNQIGSFQTKEGNGPHRADAILIAPGVVRVTGALNERGEPGLFGHKEALDWHANQASNKKRMPIVWMYGAEGMEGSRTSFINMIEVYNGLPTKLKERIKNLKCFFGYKKGRYTTSPYFKEHVNKDNLFDLVMTNAAGQTGLYFPYNQVFGMVEGNKQLPESEFIEIHKELKHHILKEEYAYHHDWINGQIIMSDQWLSIHKRWEFDKMEERVLHRIAFNYDKIYENYP
jgi:taurine dioxygenase